jgi:beta-galactosidase
MRTPPLARRQFLRATATGGAALAGWAVLSRTGNQSAAAAAVKPGAASSVVMFNEGWLFGSAGSEAALENITLPHTVTPLSWRDWDPASWEQTWVYQKEFDAPAGSSKLRTFLDIAGAMTAATPVLNGHTLPAHTGGYLPFSLELTDYLAASNVLEITLDSGFNIDVPPNRPAPYSSRSVDYNQPGGIYRDVTLRQVPQVFIADVFAKPVDVLTSPGLVAEVTIDAAVVPGSAVSLSIALDDGTRSIATTRIPVKLSATGQVTVTATLSKLKGITLWGVNNPKLYTVTATLLIGGTAVHDYTVRTGFRQASFTTDGFFLNGDRLKLFGVNRHQFFPFAGGALPARAQLRDAQILRSELNCTFVRCSHYPQSEDFLDACDELGLLVWEEMPGWGYWGDSGWEAAGYSDIRDMIVRDRNHPSVIVWGAMPNEAGEHVSEYELYNSLAHSLDDSRPTGGDGSVTDSSFVFDVFSIHDYSSLTGPDGLREPTLEPPVDAVKRPYVICETVGTLSGPGLAYRRTDSQQIQQGLATAHATVHNIARSDNRYCGVAAWAGFDYLSDAGGNCFGGVKYVGLADEFRALKPGAAIYQSQVSPSRRVVIAPAFYWHFGESYPVTILSSALICSNCDKLELYLNGSHHATLTPDAGTYGHLAYPPFVTSFTGVSGAPTLRIDGYISGSRVASRSFSADTSSDRLAVTADDTALTADGTDATRVWFGAVDSYGNARPYVTGSVPLSVSGPGVLVGDNPFAFGDAGGSGAVWIRTIPGSAGTIEVTASHPTLGSGTVSIAATGTSAPAPFGTVAVSASAPVLTAGSSVSLTASFTNNGLVDLASVVLTPSLPPGWTAGPPAVFTGLRSGGTVQTTWQVAVPSDAEPQTAALTVSAAYTGGVASGSDSVFVPYPTLADAFNNTAITSDADQAAGDIDGSGNSYSATALGLAPGGTLTTPVGLTYDWPSVSAGQPDNMLGFGQTVLVDGQPGATALGVLGACTNGSTYGTAIVRYTDGSSSYQLIYFFQFDDWPGASGPDQRVTAAISARYYNNASGTSVKSPAYVHEATIPLDPSRQVLALTFPNRGVSPVNPDVNAMHFFAVSTGTPTVYPSLAAAFNNTGITFDSDQSAGDFDGAGNTYSAQSLAAARLSPGATVRHDGLTFAWPHVAVGKPDNVLAMGQTVALSGRGSRLGFLGSSSNGSVLGTGTVHYTDGSSSDYTFTLDNFWYVAGPSNSAVATLKQRSHTVYIFFASVPIVPGREISAVTLPPNGSSGTGVRTFGMHIFALTAG